MILPEQENVKKFESSENSWNTWIFFLRAEQFVKPASVWTEGVASELAQAMQTLAQKVAQGCFLSSKCQLFIDFTSDKPT